MATTPLNGSSIADGGKELKELPLLLPDDCALAFTIQSMSGPAVVAAVYTGYPGAPSCVVF